MQSFQWQKQNNTKQKTPKPRTNPEYGHIICKVKSTFSWQPNIVGRKPRKAVFMERHGCIQLSAITRLLLESFQYLNLANKEQKYTTDRNAKDTAWPSSVTWSKRTGLKSLGTWAAHLTELNSYNAANSGSSQGITWSPSLNTPFTLINCSWRWIRVFMDSHGAALGCVTRMWLRKNGRNS